jgi:hypothetical protein
MHIKSATEVFDLVAHCEARMAGRADLEVSPG